ncbi:MAG TPA: response regulator transcription factor, partial [Actinomycetota bacterium]|nr:response regulator transcription factor [Actinomycetota bacterium]
MKVLVVEDERKIASFILKGLTAAGYETEHVTTGSAGIERAAEADVMVLDLGLPDVDGLDVLRRVRADGLDTQVIVLTARAELADRVDGLERGADDYLVKPFAFEELLARIRARVRSLEQVERRHLRFDGIRIDLLERRVSVDGRSVELSARQFELLEALVRADGKVLSRDQLLDRVWGLPFDPGTNVVDVYIGYLRRKIGAERIETVRTRGYRLVEPGSVASGTQ